MTPETLAALRGSIVKWQGIVARTESDQGTSNCPLCQMFNGDTAESDLNCVGCPVRKKTGYFGCRGTPYEDWSDCELHEGWALTEKEKRLAQDELDFLISLLPAESTDATE